MRQWVDEKRNNNENGITLWFSHSQKKEQDFCEKKKS